MAMKTTPRIKKTIAYLRVSPFDRNNEKNKSTILGFASCHDLGSVHFFEEITAERKPWRACQIAQVMAALQSGDTLIVYELARLGLNMLECMEILSVLIQNGVCIYAIKGAWRLDRSIQGEMITMAFLIAEEIEREFVAQQEIKKPHFSKKHGLIMGRPKGPGKSKLDPFRHEIEHLLANGSTQKFIAQRYHTTEANLHNWLKKRALNRKKYLSQNN